MKAKPVILANCPPEAPKRGRKAWASFNKIIRWPFVSAISLYQKTLSPDHGFVSGFYPHGFCKYDPTCSEYTRQAIEKHGVILGSIMGSWRIIRCNPWSSGGSDPVPDNPRDAFRKK